MAIKMKWDLFFCDGDSRNETLKEIFGNLGLIEKKIHMRKINNEILGQLKGIRNEHWEQIVTYENGNVKFIIINSIMKFLDDVISFRKSDVIINYNYFEKEIEDY